MHHDEAIAASPWVMRHLDQLPAGSRILDAACGAGRHTRLLLENGFSVTATDIDTSRLADLSSSSALSIVQADLETDDWPFAAENFAGIVVTNYLYRPHLPNLFASLMTGGVMIYDTFAVGNERFGKPASPNFLLQPAELLRLSTNMKVVAYEHGETQLPRPAVRQRLCAIKTN